MNQHIELTVAVPSYLQEVLIADFVDFGFSGFNQEASQIKAYIPYDEFTDQIKQLITESIHIILGKQTAFHIEVIQEKNWNEEWEKTIQPIIIGDFFIRPTWSLETCPANKTELIIDPKMAFGTGYHETTRLMLIALSKYLKTKDNVLDVGTGTGILAIAALKLNAKHAIGFDIDEWSYDNANQNAQLNQLDKSKYVFRKGTFDVVDETNFDLVIANINRSTILELKQNIIDSCKNGGVILLSGLLTSEVNFIKENESFSQLQLLEELAEGEWSGLVYRKL